MDSSESGDTSILARLRTQTRSHHEAAERAVNLDARLGSRSTYGKFLTDLYGFYTAAEQRLTDAADASFAGIDLVSRRKAFRLLDDLHALEYGRIHLSRMELCPLPPVTYPGCAWGWLYVIEGSTLGGKVLERAVGRALGLTPQHGCSFFYGYGEQTGAKWHQFCEGLTNYYQLHPDQTDRIVAGAIDLFLRFRGWLECRLT